MSAGPALAAALRATDAARALLDHAIEGAGFGGAPVVEPLAEALALAVDIHLEHDVEPCDTGYRESLLALRNHADAFIEKWAG